jgi:flagellar basal-body rod protein FlgG
MVTPGAAATQQTVSAGMQIGLGTRASATEILQSQGDFQQTGNSLDLAIQGLGYFQVLMPNGQTGYTRSGSFHLDSQGNVVTADGNALQPSLTIPADATSITIGTDGTVTVTQPGQTQSQQIGQIQLATFANPGGLNSVGSNILLPTSSSGDPIVGNPGGSEGLGTLVQGSLEQSNVNTVEEFIQMILAQRSYEANSQVAKAADQMFQEVNQMGK